MYEWSERSEGEVKVGLDHIMCSMCHTRPPLFTQLLLNMSVLAAIDNNQSITDDRLGVGFFYLSYLTIEVI